MKLSSESGFTLVEVLMAITIFAIGILAIINMQLMSTWANARARGMTEGIVFAQNQVERLSALNYSSDELKDADGDGAAGMEHRTQATADGSDLSNPRYQLFWNVRDDYPFIGTKTVRVFVVWNDQQQTKWFSLDMTKADGA